MCRSKWVQFYNAMLFQLWLIKELESISGRHGGPIDLVGHDWGAILANRAASLRPDLIKSLVFGGAAIDSKYRGHLLARLWATPLIGEFVMATMKRVYSSKTTTNLHRRYQISLPHIEVAAFDRTYEAIYTASPIGLQLV